jgi:hypothetical protein
MSSLITLSWAELMIAGQIGTMRLVASRKQGFPDSSNPNTAVKLDWKTDFEGAAAEMAYAKYRNVYYDPTVNTFKAPDVAGDQVRSTTYKMGRLIVRGKDVNEERYILVVCSAPTYRMAGWIWTSEAKKSEWFRPEDETGPSAWWVPQDALRPMETL